MYKDNTVLIPSVLSGPRSTFVLPFYIGCVSMKSILVWNVPNSTYTKMFFFLSQHCSSTTFCHFLNDSHSGLLFAYSISAVLTELFGIRIKISIDRPQRSHKYIMYSDCMFSSVFVACNTREDFSTESDERKGIIPILSFPL